MLGKIIVEQVLDNVLKKAIDASDKPVLNKEVHNYPLIPVGQVYKNEDDLLEQKYIVNKGKERVEVSYIYMGTEWVKKDDYKKAEERNASITLSILLILFFIYGVLSIGIEIMFSQNIDLNAIRTLMQGLCMIGFSTSLIALIGYNRVQIANNIIKFKHFIFGVLLVLGLITVCLGLFYGFLLNELLHYAVVYVIVWRMNLVLCGLHELE